MKHLFRTARALLSFTLILSFALGSTHIQAQGLGTANQRAMAEEAFFLDLRFRIETFMEANKAKIYQLRRCLRAEIDPKNHRAINQAFCKTQLEIVRDNIRVLYPRMRHYLILSQLVKPSGKKTLIEQFESPYPDLQETVKIINHNSSLSKLFSFMQMSLPKAYIKTNFTNPIDLRFDGIKIPFEKPTPLEIKSAIEGLKDKEGQVRAYGVGAAQLHTRSCMKAKTPAYICSNTHLKYDVKNNFTYWQFSSPAVYKHDFRYKHDGNSIQREEGVIADSHKVYARLEAQYYEIIQTNPYVALVTSSNPSRQALLTAFDQMYTASTRTLVRFKNFQQKLDNERSFFKRSVDWFKAEDNRTRTLELMNYAPIMGHVLEIPGEKMDMLYGYPFTELVEELSIENSNAQFKKMGVQIAGLIVANIAVCWLPWSRVASTTGRALKISFTGGQLSKALSPMCFALTSIPLNSYFLYESIADYARAYEEVFSGIDEDQYETYGNNKTHFIREVRSLSDSQQAILWSLLFMPIGTKEIRVAISNNIPSLSAHAMKRIQRYLDRRGY